MSFRSFKSFGLALSLVSGLILPSCSEPSTPQLPELVSWELGEPAVVVGARDEGPAAFSPIRSVTVGPRSELYVLLPQEHEVRVFGGDGEFLSSIGGEGEGPGESSRPWEIGFVGDTLWVLDASTRRVSYFHQGVFLRVQPFPSVENLHPERISRVTGVVAGPRLVVATHAMAPFQPKITTSPGLLMTHSNGAFDTLAAINVDHVGGLLIRGPPGAIEVVRPFPQPFSPSAVWAISPRGSVVVVVDRSESPDHPGSFTAAKISASGDTLFFTRHDYVPAQIPEEVTDSILTRFAVGGFTADDVRESAFLPPNYPPVSNVLISVDGTTWIARESIPDRPRRWQVLSEQGATLAEVDAAIGFELQWVDREAVWGLVLDEFDVPYLVKRPILRD